MVLIFSFLFSKKGFTQCLPGDIGGTVYLESPVANASTANTYGVQNINEPGVAGVAVVVIDANGVVQNDTTDALGNWGVTPATYPVRVEFSWTDTWMEPAPNALATSNSDVQFFAASECAASLGLYYPDEYCNITPDVVTTCYVSGDPLAGGSTAPIDAVVSFQYDWLSDTITPYHDAVMSEVGAVWGVAYSKRNQNAFLATIMKRHVGLGPIGIGGIYRVDYSTPSPTTSSFIDLSLLGVDVGTEPTRSLSSDYDSPNTDSLMFDAAGKLGLGDIEISEDGNTLFVVNLKSRKVVTVDLTSFNATGSIPGTAQIDSLPALPAIVCNNGEIRPFALKYRRGKLYIGAVCSGENTGVPADLTAIVYEYDLVAGTYSEAINEFSLDYTKGGAQDAICNTWSPWIGVYDTPFRTCQPTPMLSDIEFDSDSTMILAFADRYTFQKFTLQRDSADTGAESVINGGDVLRAYFNGTNYSLESGGLIPNGDGCGANGQGIGGGEFFCGDSIGSEHSEIVLGAAAVLHGTGEVMLTTINPVNYNSGGVRRFNTTTGSSDTTMGYELYLTPGSTFPGGNGYAVKGGGIGDLELLCESPPIEVYSFIWQDTNNDGIQDPTEMGIPNVDVSLYDINGNLQWIDSTDANGFFSFSDTLQAFTDYYLVIGNNGDFNLLDSTLNDSLALTLPNTGMGVNTDKNDSDFTIASGIHTNIDGYPTFAFTTGNDGSNYHSFDIGFFPPCTNPGLVTTEPTICLGSSVDMTTFVTDTTGVTGVMSFYTSLADANTEMNAIAALVSPTDTTQYYVRKNATDLTCFDIDSLIVNVNPLPNLLTSDLDICIGDTININVGVLETTSIPVDFTYYTTYADAIAEANALATTSVYPTDTIEYYIRANTVASPTCSDIDSLIINVASFPNLLTSDVTICSGDTTDLSTNVSETTGLSVDYTYYPTYTDALAETNALATTLVYPNDTTQYFVRANPTAGPACSAIDSLTVNAAFCPNYDLALKMVLANGQSNTIDPGDTVTYTMWVYNQGNMPAYDIVLTHYASVNMTFDGSIPTNASWILIGSNPTDTISGPLAGGDSIAVDLAMVINDFYSGASVTSFTEISSSDDDTDDTNPAPTDEDSVTDLIGLNDPYIDDEVNDNPDNAGDDDDHDGSIIFINSVFDLAMIMDAGANPVDPCDTVTYTSWIYNQGNTPAYNVEVTNYLATGMNFDGTIAGNGTWALVGANPTSTVAGPIAPGDSASVTISLVVDCAFAGTSIDNSAELSAYDDDTDGTNAGPTDEDSVTDTDGTNDPNIDDEINDSPDNPGDDDDHDGASIAVTQPVLTYDLAMLMQTPANPVDPCDTVTYTMVVYNQGDYPAYNVEVTNYLATGMNFDGTIAGNGTWALVGANPTSTVAGPIAPGDSASVTISLVVDCAFAGTSIDNSAELSAYDDDTDGTNAGPTDEDSVTDTDGTNDPNIDDEINDSPDNPGDDDDHDGASIAVTQPVLTYDLAMLMQTPANPVDPCDTVTYTMVVYNQGDYPAYNVEVTNYLATGMSFDGTIAGNAMWSMVGGNPTGTIAGPIAPGTNVSVTIDLVVDCGYVGTSIDHAAELSAYDDDTDGTNAGPTDEDSVTDADGTNDPNIDDEINDSPDNPADDDDHDGAVITINQTFDLAFLMQNPTGSLNPCDTVTYTMFVYNQGTVPVYNVTITDYLSTGMIFDPTLPTNTNWSLVSGQPTFTLAGPIPAGNSALISLSLVLDCAYTGVAILNAAEISGYDDDTDNTNAGPTDVDSVTDTDDTNDQNIDDEINNNPDNPADDDDHDGAIIPVNQGFDLALVMATPPNPVGPCDTVTYTIWVYNQGNIPAYNIVLSNYTPTGMTFDATIAANSGWTSVAGLPTYVIAGPLAGGDSTLVDIALVVDCGTTVTSANNAVEISAYDDDTDNTNAGPTDEDSVTDTDSANDLNIDDEYNDFPDNPGDDDDHDGATITVTQPAGFDLALLMPTPVNPVNPCDTVTYTMWVYNQGPTDAYNVSVANYIGTGMSFDTSIPGNTQWALVGGTPIQSILGPIPSGDSVMVSIVLVVDCNFTGTSINNAAEIIGYDDDTDGTNAGPTDEDSVTDADGTNDPNIDDEINDSPDNPADDDDHDGAVITINQTFDLAFLMQNPTGSLNPCDTVTYTMFVYNQGTVPAYNVTITDYLSTGMTFDPTLPTNTNWSLVSGQPTFTLAGPIPAGNSALISLSLVLDCAYTGVAILNAAEISGYDDDTDNTNAGPTDVDSVTDTDDTNDQNIDDEINNNPDNPADDDDHDGAIIPVNQGFDLALVMATPPNPVGPCDTVTYTIWVYNQGNIPAYNIVLSNYTPTGMTFDATIAANSGWTSVAGLPTYVIAGPLAGGDSTLVDIALVVDCGTTVTSANNAVEISAYDDDTDNTNAGPTDEDSVTDTDSTNDMNIDNEYNDFPDNPGDDDDHDGATITIVIPTILTIDTLYFTTPYETSVPNICVDLLELGAPVTQTTTCNFPANGVLVLNSPSECVDYIPGAAYSGQDTACVAICDALGNCDTTYLIFTIEAPCGDILAVNTLTADLADCTNDADFCLDIPIIDVSLYSFDLNGIPYSAGIAPCDYDTTYVYTYFSLPGNGTAGPYMIDLWGVNGMLFSGLVNDMQDLTDSMNIWDPTGNWMLDLSNSSIRGGGSNTYTDIDVTQMGSGMTGTIPMVLSLVPNGTEVSIPSGNHEFVITDMATGCRDTIDITVNCPSCNDLFSGPYTIEADHCDTTAGFCTPIILTDIFDYSISDNGSSFTGLFGGCNNDTLIIYNYVSIPGNGNAGPYEVDNWTVNGFMYSGVFQDVAALLDSMNTWDASGSWMLNGFNIEGGNYLNTYGNIVVSQFGTVVSILNPNIQLIPASAAVFLEPGPHELIFIDTLTGCIDTTMVQVDCVDCDDVIDDVLALTAADDCDGTAIVCMDINPDDIANYTITVNGQLQSGSFLGCENDTMTTYLTIGFNNPGAYVLDSWTVNGTTYSAVNFATAQELVDSMNVWDLTTNWSLNGLLIVGGNPASSYSTMLISSGGMNVASADANIQLFPSSSAIALDTGTYNIMILDNLTGCLDSSVVTITCPPVPIDCDFIVEDFVPLSINGCIGEAALCVEVDPNDLMDYTIFDNGSLFTGSIGGCEFDSILVYNYSFLTGGGNFGPYMLDSWMLNGQMFSGQFENIGDLVDSLNTWDPLSPWSNDITNSTIRGSVVENNYGALEITHIVSGTTISLPVEYEPYATSSQFGITAGSHEMIFSNQVNGCADTVEVLVACIDPAVYIDTIGVGEVDTMCFDLSELPGVAGGVVNFCEPSSGEYVVFDFLAGSYCLTATGMEVGQDSACIEICDDLGFCDTTWVTVVVTDGTLIPQAWPDVDTTMTGGTVVVTVTNNDNGGVLGIDTFIILDQPTNGSIIVDYENGNIEYTPNTGYCSSTIPDSLTYAICNSAGCDTSTVSIYVLCTDIGFVSGFSPNGDGVNDYFMIEGIGNYPEHTLTIFNRWGNQVYYSEDYKNDWAGTFNEDLAQLPDGTYFYVFEDGQGNSYSGYVQIHR